MIPLENFFQNIMLTVTLRNEKNSWVAELARAERTVILNSNFGGRSRVDRSRIVGRAENRWLLETICRYRRRIVAYGRVYVCPRRVEQRHASIERINCSLKVARAEKRGASRPSMTTSLDPKDRSVHARLSMCMCTLYVCTLLLRCARGVREVGRSKDSVAIAFEPFRIPSLRLFLTSARNSGLPPPLFHFLRTSLPFRNRFLRIGYP